jgi:hypothetical protein
MGGNRPAAADPTSIFARYWDANGLIASLPDQSLIRENKINTLCCHGVLANRAFPG